jgi:hypothetical protein
MQLSRALTDRAVDLDHGPGQLEGDVDAVLQVVDDRSAAWEGITGGGYEQEFFFDSDGGELHPEPVPGRRTPETRSLGSAG